MAYVVIRQAATRISNDEYVPGVYAVWQRPETGRGGVLISQHATEDEALEAKSRYEEADLRRSPLKTFRHTLGK